MKSHTTMVLHVLGSILFMLIPFIVSDSFPDIQRFINNPLTGIEVFFQAKMLGVFYLNYFWLIPYVFNKKALWDLYSNINYYTNFYNRNFIFCIA